MFLSILFRQCVWYGVKIAGYCLMTNHYHLIAAGEREDSIPVAVGRTNQEYSVFRHKKEGRTGQLWQGRFGSELLTEAHFWTALCYVERNPVEAGLVQSAWEWEWSSARVHLGLATEGGLDCTRWRERYDAATWRQALQTGIGGAAHVERAAAGKIRYHGTQGSLGR